MKKAVVILLVLIGLFSYTGDCLSADEQVEEQTPFTYDDNGKRDPFWALVTSSGTIMSYETDYTIADLALEGIMSGEADQSLAIINGRVVKQGDKIGNFEVLMVSGNKVILKEKDQKFELRLKKEE